MSCCPSLPAPVLAWLAAPLAHLLPPRPPGQGGNPPLSLDQQGEVGGLGQGVTDRGATRRYHGSTTPPDGYVGTSSLPEASVVLDSLVDAR